MSKEVIMLARHDLGDHQVDFPAVVYEKLDGVAADFYGKSNGDISVQTRYGEPIKSVQHITDWLFTYLEPKAHLCGELFIPNTSFPEISGKVRSHSQHPELQLHVYDYYEEGSEHFSFKDRMITCAQKVLQFIEDGDPVQIIPAIARVDNQEELTAVVNKFLEENPEAEGVMIRPMEGKHAGYFPGKRSRGLQSRKRVATEDARVVDVIPAVDKNGELKGMAGSLLVEVNNVTFPIGAGSMLHSERGAVLLHKESYVGKMVEFSHKPDKDYKGYREPRFKRWRPDKD